MQALMAFVVIFAVTNIFLERPLDMALLYGGVAALIMGPLMGYLSRDVVDFVPGTTPLRAADAAVALLGGTQSPNADGSVTVQTGFNYFWLTVHVSPAKDGVTLKGSANHIRYVKAKLTGA
jgi:hypothetical protein